MAFGTSNIPKTTTTTKKKPKKVTAVELTAPVKGPITGGDEARAIQRTASVPAAPTITKNTGFTSTLPPGSAVPIGGGVATGSTPGTFSSASTGGDRGLQNQPGSLNTGGVVDPMSGFASRYDPTQVNSIYSDPNIILQDVMRMNNQPLSNSRIAGMGQYSDQMMNMAGLISLAQGGDIQDEALINTIAELIDNGMGAGGASVDAVQALQMLLDPTASTAQKGYLYGMPGDTQFGLSEQNSALQPLFQAAVSGANPFQQQAMASAYRGASSQANENLGKGGQNPTITNYLRAALKGIIPGLDI